MTSTIRPAPRRLGDCHSIADLRHLAQRRLPRAVFDFFDGGAEDERTLRANGAAYEHYRFAPHVLVDVAEVSLQSMLLGTLSAMPLAIGPVGGAGFGHHLADLGLARAAAKHGIPYTLSSTATTALETIAREVPGRHWFQAYALCDRDCFWRMVERARVANYEGLMITLDLPVRGKRERDLHNHFSIPFHYTARNVFDFATRPRWALDRLLRGRPKLENIRELDSNVRNASVTVSSLRHNHDASFDWARLAEVRSRWPRKLIVKGVARSEDAQRLAVLGVDAIVVSNHGGRQLDNACATLDVLPEVLQGAAGRVPVWLDGGIRRGSDIAKALALGAQAVLVGRATLFGAVVAGEVGAMRSLDILRDELRRTLQLCGVRDVRDLTPELLRPVSPTARRSSTDAI